MTPKDALIELLERVEASQGAAVLINGEELSHWPSAAVKAMKSQELIVKAHPASSAICPGCEYDCVMPVHTSPATTGAPPSFIVCDKRSDINRVPVPTERLTQWQCSVNAVCGFVAVSLGLRRSNKQTASADLWEIGIATGNKRSQMLCLQVNGALVLVAGSNKVPLAELIEYHDGKYTLDGAMICRLLDASSTADNRYTPSHVKREARKLDTQSMYDGWRKVYSNLKKNHPNMSDVWCSRKIAKMDISNGRNAETIRKQMKK